MARGAAPGREALADGGEDSVPGGVSEAVVDRLEAVEVRKENGRAAVPADDTVRGAAPAVAGQRDPGERRNGVQMLRIGIVEQPSAMERFFVASERAAVVPLLSFHGAEGFDCGILLGREAAVGLVQHGREACASARPVETTEAGLALTARGTTAGRRGET